MPARRRSSLEAGRKDAVDKLICGSVSGPVSVNCSTRVWGKNCGSSAAIT
jgi:hypothetical protein